MNNALRQSLLKLHLSAGALLTALSCLPGCGSDAAKTTPVDTARPSDDSNVAEISPGITVSDDEVIFQTEEYALDPGAERFLCYAATVDQDLVIDGYQHHGLPTLHHVVFARTLAPEPDGMTECDVLFRYTWAPMYLAGAGDSSLDFPPDTAHVVPAGTQLLAQMHLYNTSDSPAKGSLAVKMHRSTAVDPAAINIYVFGNFDVHVPPLQKSTVESTCKVSDEINFIAAFPHMHKLGTDLTFQVGPSADQMNTVYQRTPYSFDDQRLDKWTQKLSPGDTTHIACNYQNTTDQMITFGESTRNEMCFLIGFAVRPQMGGCFTGSPPPLQ
jgi:hypothetical protein